MDHIGGGEREGQSLEMASMLEAAVLLLCPQAADQHRADMIRH